MNNKGFTLTEVLVTITLISITTVIVLRQISTTLSVSSNEAYKIMKNNIIKASENYVKESEAHTINSSFSFEDNNTFNASVLENYGYFSNMKSPIDGKNVGNCLIITATKENENILINLQDNCY